MRSYTISEPVRVQVDIDTEDNFPASKAFMKQGLALRLTLGRPPSG